MSDRSLKIKAWRDRYESDCTVTMAVIARDVGVSAGCVQWYAARHGWKGRELRTQRRLAALSKAKAGGLSVTLPVASCLHRAAAPSIWAAAGGVLVSTGRVGGRHVVVMAE